VLYTQCSGKPAELDLLHAMSVCLGYSYDKAQIKTGACSSGYGETEYELIEIRKELLEIFKGNKKFPIAAEFEGEVPRTQHSTTT
jgi:hypothetical protein